MRPGVLGEVEHGEPGVRPPVLHPDQPRRVAGGRQAQVREPSLGGLGSTIVLSFL